RGHRLVRPWIQLLHTRDRDAVGASGFFLLHASRDQIVVQLSRAEHESAHRVGLRARRAVVDHGLESAGAQVLGPRRRFRETDHRRRSWGAAALKPYSKPITAVSDSGL